MSRGITEEQFAQMVKGTVHEHHARVQPLPKQAVTPPAPRRKQQRQKQVVQVVKKYRLDVPTCVNMLIMAISGVLCLITLCGNT